MEVGSDTQKSFVTIFLSSQFPYKTAQQNI